MSTKQNVHKNVTQNSSNRDMETKQRETEVFIASETVQRVLPSLVCWKEFKQYCVPIAGRVRKDFKHN